MKIFLKTKLKWVFLGLFLLFPILAVPSVKAAVVPGVIYHSVGSFSSDTPCGTIIIIKTDLPTTTYIDGNVIGGMQTGETETSTYLWQKNPPPANHQVQAIYLAPDAPKKDVVKNFDTKFTCIPKGGSWNGDNDSLPKTTLDIKVNAGTMTVSTVDANQKASQCTITLSGKVNGQKLDFTWKVTGTRKPEEKVYLTYYHIKSYLNPGESPGQVFSVEMTASPYSIDKPNQDTAYRAVVRNAANTSDLCVSSYTNYSSSLDAFTDSSTKTNVCENFGPTTGGSAESGTGTSTYANPNCSGSNEESSIRQGLEADKCDAVGCWAITTWKVVLGLANIGLVIILIFIAIVNILRIQYDTYAIKKMLPILIIGIILANFSLLIIRMFVDFANILTSLFTHNCTPGEFASNLISAANVGGGSTQTAFAGTGGMGLGTLLLWFIFALFVMIAFLILGFLFYIRYAVVLVCAIVAPLAFVAMAFPPTQGFFKQWWGWLTKFIFMKPISFFLLYLAGEILIAGTKSQSGLTHITLWVVVAFLVYLSIIIPFKLGGAIMGAWGGAGKKAAGWLGNRADYGMAKYLKWSPKSAYQAYKMGSEEQRERAYALATGKQRDVWTKALSLGRRKSDYYKQAERALGMKTIKSEVGDLDLKSREGLAEAFMKLHSRGDKQALQILLEEAAQDYMVADIMEELSPEVKVKLGYGRDESISTDYDSQLDFLGRVIGKSNFEGMNRVEEAFIKSGLATGKRHPLNDAKTGYEQADLEKQRVMAVKRFQSPDPIKAIRNFRIDSLIGKNGELTDLGRRFLETDGLTAAHIDLIRQGRARQSTYQKAIDPKNERFWRDLEGFEQGRNLKRAITRAGFAPGTQPNTVNVPDQTGPVNVSQLTAAQATPQVKAQLAQRMSRMSLDQLNILGGNISANASLRDLTPLVNSITRLRQATERAGQLSSLSRQEADSSMQDIGQSIADELGSAMKVQLNPAQLVADTISKANLLDPNKLKNIIQEKISQSNTTIISPGGQNVSASQLVNIYQNAQTRSRGDETKTKVEFSGKLDELGASERDKHEAWKIIDAYEAKAPPKEERTQRESELDFEQLWEEEG